MSNICQFRFPDVFLVCLTDEHFIHDDAQRPPVTQLVVSRLHEDFRGDVVGRSHGRISLRVTQRDRK